MIQHTMSHETDRSDANGNMHTITPVCSCGWRGYPVADYNDDQMFRIGQQAKRHLEEAARTATA